MYTKVALLPRSCLRPHHHHRLSRGGNWRMIKASSKPSFAAICANSKALEKCPHQQLQREPHLIPCAKASLSGHPNASSAHHESSKAILSQGNFISAVMPMQAPSQASLSWSLSELPHYHTLGAAQGSCSLLHLAI